MLENVVRIGTLPIGRTSRQSIVQAPASTLRARGVSFLDPCPVHRYGFRRSKPVSDFFQDFLGAARGRCGTVGFGAAGSGPMGLRFALAADGAAETGAGGELSPGMPVIAGGKLDLAMLVIADDAEEAAAEG